MAWIFPSSSRVSVQWCVMHVTAALNELFRPLTLLLVLFSYESTASHNCTAMVSSCKLCLGSAMKDVRPWVVAQCCIFSRSTVYTFQPPHPLGNFALEPPLFRSSLESWVLHQLRGSYPQKLDSKGITDGFSFAAGCTTLATLQ